MFGYGSANQQQQAAAAAAAISAFGTGGGYSTQAASAQQGGGTALGGISSIVGSAYAQFGRAAIDAASAAAGYGVCAPQPFVPSSDTKRLPSVLPGSANAIPLGSGSGGGGGSGGSISTHYAGYEQAVYAAANSYVQAKSAGRTSQWMKPKKRPGFGHPSSSGPAGLTAFYCEVCRISCAGNQTFKEHLEGKIHKRKQALASSTVAQQSTINTMTTFKCEACNVSCASKDTYDAHVKGSKHIRTINLLKKMNKEIPASAEPTIIPGSGAGAAPPPVKKVVGVAGTRFVGGTTLTSTGEQVLGAPGIGDIGNGAMSAVLENNIKPVGEEFIDEQRDIYGKVKNFTCKLCQCSFTDPSAKNMHLKGRRHRLNYKAKVNPDLEVEPKPNEKYHAKGAGGGVNSSSSGGGARRTEYPGIVPTYPPARRGPAAPPAQMPFFFPPSQREMDESDDDRHVVAKDLLVQPSKEDGQAVEKLVGLVEKTLKAVSDKLAEEEKNPSTDRCMRGVMRVGLLAKSLLLRGDSEVNLVVLCSALPTRSLLTKIGQYFSQFAEKESSDVPEVKEDQENSSLLSQSSAVASTGGSEAKSKADEGDSLPSGPCLKALAELRHAKYYQVKCLPLQSIAITLRIVRDISKRVPTWRPLTIWAMELLVEKAISSSSPIPLSPGEAVRRVFEVLASGVIIGKNFSLTDPCEKEVVDALHNLSAQEREDITSSAQHALRLICFNQIHKILGIDRISDDAPTAVEEPSVAESTEGTVSSTVAATATKTEVGENSNSQQTISDTGESSDRKRARESSEGDTRNSDEQDAKKLKSAEETKTADESTAKTDA